MTYVVRHFYKDFAGSGFFYLGENKFCYFGIDEEVIKFNSLEEAEVAAKAANRPGTDDNWVVKGF